MKKKILALAVIAICFSIVACNTLAFFTADVRAHNIITTNGVDIVLEEWQLVEEEKVPYPKDIPIKVMPGVTVSKIVTVQNKEAEAYIRADLDIQVFDPTGQVIELDEDTLNHIIDIKINDTYWKKLEKDDGWFYYSHSTDTGEVTEPLFTEVVFSGVNMTNEYQNCTVEIIVDAQAVQAANNGDDVLAADGWPNN